MQVIEDLKRMATPVRTVLPKTQKQQNYNESWRAQHPTRNRMVQATPQQKRNAHPFASPSSLRQNAYPSSSQQRMTESTYHPVIASPEHNRKAQPLLTPSFPQGSQQVITQSLYRPRAMRSIDRDHQNQFMPQNTYNSPTQKRTGSTSDDGALVSAQNHYGDRRATGVSPRKHKEEDMARKRVEMQEQLNRDAQDYLKKKKEKEQKKREEYIMRHKFMYPDLFGGQKLGSGNCENVCENLQADIDTVTVDPASLRTEQEEARRKMQEEYDRKAKKHAEKMKEIEEIKHAQQAELFAKMKAEEDKYKVGRLNTMADRNTNTKSDCAAVKLNENEVTRRTQNQLDKIDLQNNSSTKIKTDCYVQVKKLEEEELDKDDAESQEELKVYHYKYGIPPVVPTLKLRLDSTKNTVNKRSDEELAKNSADTISKVEEKSGSNQISTIKKEKAVDTEKNLREEMRRARIKMQEEMNLKVQKFLVKSKQASDSL